MDVVRTFVAVLIDQDQRARVAHVQDRAKKLAPDVKWVAPENFHVTLKFLGSVREDTLPSVYASVDEAVRGFGEFEVSLSGIGAFPDARRARVVWVGIGSGRDRLQQLATRVEKSLTDLGFEKDDKGFRAHITIGRVKTSRFLDDLARGITEIDAHDMGTQKVTSVAVMRSDLRREGPVYTPLKVIDIS